ncbi:hypothetical protein [Effusibacillus dendaii]|uniref:Uncharacterized protein n=1 Tax=Effusibacillus dendaii TaxID=2743772 RepID=A0A7I8D9L8_9BACL|nr:hypothetical protein [Effusibacillus dendaii]BCJ86775.1 hypothetical protein skT53_17600 [Effusibacillus dendaii]
MATASPLLHEFWEKSLHNMPRDKVTEFLKEIGFTYSTSRLSDDELRKILFGLIAKLDETSQQDTIRILRVY